jgi:hypothetical protein
MQLEDAYPLTRNVYIKSWAATIIHELTNIFNIFKNMDFKLFFLLFQGAAKRDRQPERLLLESNADLGEDSRLVQESGWEGQLAEPAGRHQQTVVAAAQKVPGHTQPAGVE